MTRYLNGWRYNKSIIVINGKGSCGKDTLIKYFAENSGIRIMNISSIDPIKEILLKTGYWDGKEKSDEIRKLLSDMKKAFEDFNHLPSIYIQKQAEYFSTSNIDLMFVHIREPEEISRFVNYVETRLRIPIITLLVNSDRTEDHQYGNQSDDDVNNYSYDFIYKNNYDEERSCKLFIYFVKGLICAE